MKRFERKPKKSPFGHMTRERARQLIADPNTPKQLRAFWQKKLDTLPK